MSGVCHPGGWEQVSMTVFKLSLTYGRIEGPCEGDLGLGLTLGLGLRLALRLGLWFTLG